jgi:hypothetical protein
MTAGFIGFLIFLFWEPDELIRSMRGWQEEILRFAESTHASGLAEEAGGSGRHALALIGFGRFSFFRDQSTSP